MPTPNYKILIGVCGGIAAYKTADFVSELRKSGHDVHVVMTANAQKIISPLALETLSHNPVITDLFCAGQTHRPDHIELKDKANLFVVAPATANLLAKAAAGLADDALTTLLISVTCPILLAPAMNTDMWENSIVQRNLETVQSFGIHILPPVAGELACGDVGYGKMATVEALLKTIHNLLAN